MRRIVDQKSGVQKASKKKDINKVLCPHCGKDVSVNPGQLLGQKSGQARKGQSLMMRELVELRWSKIKDKNNKVLNNNKSIKTKDFKSIKNKFKLKSKPL